MLATRWYALCENAGLDGRAGWTALAEAYGDPGRAYHNLTPHRGSLHAAVPFELCASAGFASLLAAHRTGRWDVEIFGDLPTVL